MSFETDIKTLPETAGHISKEKKTSKRSRWNWLWRFAPLLSFTVVWLIWEGLSHLIDLTLFPPPSKFLAYLKEEDFSIGIGPEQVSLSASILSSCYRVLMGLAFGFVVALILGTLISLSRPAARFIVPLVQFCAPIAPVAWIPIGILLFGIGNKAAIFLVFMGNVFVVTLGTVAVIWRVDKQLLQKAATLGANRFQQWRYVVIPAILPQVFTLLRINFLTAWMAVLAAEMVGLKDGLGAIINIGRESNSPRLILVGMFFIALSGYIIDNILLTLQRKIWKWERNIAGWGGWNE